jgi:membrane protein required for colicin V production
VTVFDYAVLGIIGFSVLLGLLRGFIRESLDLAGWVVAFLAARAYGVQAAGMLTEYLPNENLRMVGGFLAVFLLALLLASLLAVGLSEVVKKVGLGLLDRLLGLAFGCARGVVVVGVLVLLGGMTSLPQRQEWQDATFSAPSEALVLAATPWLPEQMTRYLDFDQQVNLP